MQRRYHLALLSVLFATICSSVLHAAEEDGFRELFDGKTLDGWTQRGGNAKYEIVDNTIVGTSVAQTPNSFLCTKQDYGDFILELELMVDNELNSGVQIRSQWHDKPTKFKDKEIPAGRVHGYQVEIDPSKRAYSGGIYDEARRGWLYEPCGAQHKAAREAFKHGEWNKYRIVAKGDSIKTWVNGVPVTKLKDDLDASGFIALQVHSVKDEFAGKQVRWRNIRIKKLNAKQLN